jgi:hypothetical protein
MVSSQSLLHSLAGRGYCAVTGTFCAANTWSPRFTVTVASQRPAIITLPGPLYRPPPSCFNGTVFRISGIFMAGIAAMNNSTDTSTSVTGCPPDITITLNVLSPVFGGLGSVVNVTSTP